jgi:two-component system sensor histidine kinase DegS
MKTIIRAQSKELTRLTGRLVRETARREKAEASLKQSKQHYGTLLARSNLAKEQKKLLARQVILAQEEERRQISRTLHDEVSQILTGINVRLVTLSRTDLKIPRKFQADIAATRKMVEHSIKVVHRFARELRPVLLDDLGLIPALHAFMKIMTRQTGLQITFTAFNELEILDTARRTALFRVVQSSLNNVARHAKASHVTVRFQKHISPCGSDVQVTIHDDGKSFKVERVLLSKRFKRLGILGMRERVEMFGGSLDITSTPEDGTTVTATMPFDNKRS